MAKLIDADKFSERILRFAKRLEDLGMPDRAKAVRAVAKGIKLEKTVDAVEVVRCGACKEWLEIEDTGGAGYCHHPCWLLAGFEPPIVQFADFCSYGERRTDG